MSQVFLAIISFLGARPLAGYDLHAEELRDVDLLPRVDPRGDVCGWRCR
jgi:hypothetical protein